MAQQRPNARTNAEDIRSRTADRPPPLKPWQQEWQQKYGVNEAKLLSANGALTRYGRLDIDGHQFIVGPKPSNTEILVNRHVFDQLVASHPEIGAIFSVEPREHSDRARPFYAQPGRVEAQTARLSVERMEFQGMETIAKRVSAAAFWVAGRGVATFMRNNPGKVAIVYSEKGISRPCAVIASAFIQLNEAKYGENRPSVDQALYTLIKQITAQRSRFSVSHLQQNTHEFSEILAAVSLLHDLRTPGRWPETGDRIIPRVMSKMPEMAAHSLVLHDDSGTVVSCYDAAGEQHGEAAQTRQPLPNAIHLYGGVGHYHSGNAHAPTHDDGAASADHDSFFLAIHQALSANPNPIDDSPSEAVKRWRNAIAEYVADHFEESGALASVDDGVVLIPLILGQTRWSTFQYSSAAYQGVHTDRITQETIDPDSPDAVRLITQLANGKLVCDNKYYDVHSIADWYKSCNEEGQPLTSPTTRAEVVQLLAKRGEEQRIERIVFGEE